MNQTKRKRHKREKRTSERAAADRPYRFVGTASK